ncbi:hypothetical protein KI688_005766 [Linnemannia hyalina]|uniref:Yeast cell wall synthesis Kre9/Knh1-like N-terminal domain-containing protein n=1 Tax=Linnemannia hyalina TaxID=64524 RepID=A0A9P7Y1I7_9FUNG|nr:hypothetical protein KI688_005766 [Linnemannia hyalina]
MKSIALITLSTLALVSQATAQILAYSAPISATQWTAGKSATISWTNSCNEVVGNTTFPVYLNQQVGLYQVQVPGIPELGYLDCKKAGKITVLVPATIPQGNDYSILVTNGGNQSYSALFTILSTIPGSTTLALPTTTVAAVTTTATTVPPTKTASAAPVVTTTPPTTPNQAGALKTGSQVAFVVVAAVASLLL